jgi:acetolactate synthase-1/2/3 large subunit
MDSIPLVCITGQVPTTDRLDAFQECDTVGITRPCTKHNWLVKDVNDLPRILHEAFRVLRPRAVRARSSSTFRRTSSSQPAPIRGRPRTRMRHTRATSPAVRATRTRSGWRLRNDDRGQAADPLHGGGVINSGPQASQLLRELVSLTGFPITSTLMGLGAYPASRQELAGHAGHAWHLRSQHGDA